MEAYFSNNFTQRYSELQPQKSNITIEMVLVLQTYMLTVSFKILQLIFWFLIRSNDSVPFHNSEMHSLHPICGSTRYESLQWGQTQPRHHADHIYITDHHNKRHYSKAHYNTAEHIHSQPQGRHNNQT